jgi:hypothetical protein
MRTYYSLRWVNLFDAFDDPESLNADARDIYLTSLHINLEWLFIKRDMRSLELFSESIVKILWTEYNTLLEMYVSEENIDSTDVLKFSQLFKKLELYQLWYSDTIIHNYALKLSNIKDLKVYCTSIIPDLELVEINKDDFCNFDNLEKNNKSLFSFISLVKKFILPLTLVLTFILVIWFVYLHQKKGKKESNSQ